MAIDTAMQLGMVGLGRMGANIHYVDCGTSGGVWGLERGYCLMIGGQTEVVARLDPIFRSVAPGQNCAEPPPPARAAAAPLLTVTCIAAQAGQGIS